MTQPADAGLENLGRLKSKLRRHPAAMTALRGMGLNGATVDRLHLGLREPYRSRQSGRETRDALCFPVLGDGMRPIGRYANVNLAGVTVDPQHAESWGAGAPIPYRLGSFDRGAVAVVTADVVDAWLAWQLARSERPDLAFISRSHAGGWPSEWKTAAYWSGFARVVLLPGTGAADFLRDVAPRMGRDVRVASLPPSIVSLGKLAGAAGPSDLDGMIDGAASRCELTPGATPLVMPASEPERLADAGDGTFAAAPILVGGAFRDGMLHYPFTVEQRGMEVHGRGDARFVQAYRTMVVRSDGRVLTAETLPAPRGTPAEQRILALSDGTRIMSEPIASRRGSWSYPSIVHFVEWRRAGGDPPFRALLELLTDVERFLRSRVRLPIGRQHLLAALYVLISHCFGVFDALPLILVLGERGTGKSELGEAVARLSCNATVAGQLRAAGMIRLIDETRGLLVLDDMDGDGRSSIVGTGDLAQALKTSYKRSTALKPVADRGGRVRLIDFFGPKLISRTRAVDPVLGSRAIVITTAAMPSGDGADEAEWDGAALDDLRDELHCWAMASASELDRIYRRLAGGRTDRRAEITAPMRALAELAGGDVAVDLEMLLADRATFG